MTFRVQTRAHTRENDSANTRDSGALRTLALLVLCVAVVVLLLPDASHASVEKLIRQKFGRAHDDTALCIASSESTGTHRPPWRFDPRAVSDTGDYGVFQLNLRAHPWLDRGRVLELAYNIGVAYRMSRRGTSWWPWTGTYGRGLCRGLT